MVIVEGSLINGRYKVLSQITKGGMGTIYRVTDQFDGKEYAIKQLVSKHLKGKKETFLNLFKREFETLSRMDHSNILKVYQIFEEEDEHFYSMEFLPGESLKKWVTEAAEKGHRCNEMIALDILLQLARALHYVHEKGIIHHDVHPHNVQLIRNENFSSGLQVKLLDFGISLPKEHQSSKEIKIGAINYKSPEHYRGDLLDYSADIYCYGSIIYEVFTGKQPFDISKFDSMLASSFAAMSMHSLKKVPHVTGLNRKIASDINNLIQISMEKEAADRFQSMQEIIEYVEDILFKLKSNS